MGIFLSLEAHRHKEQVLLISKEAPPTNDKILPTISLIVTQLTIRYTILLSKAS